MATIELDDDITSQIKHAMGESIANPEAHIRQLRVSTLLVEQRVRRMERIGWWIGTSIVAGSVGVILTVIGAAYSLGARMEALTQVSERVGLLEGRVAREHAER